MINKFILFPVRDIAAIYAPLYCVFALAVILIVRDHHWNEEFHYIPMFWLSFQTEASRIKKKNPIAPNRTLK